MSVLFCAVMTIALPSPQAAIMSTMSTSSYDLTKIHIFKYFKIKYGVFIIGRECISIQAMFHSYTPIIFASYRVGTFLVVPLFAAHGLQ